MIIYSDFARRVRDAVRSLPSFRIDDEDLKLYAWAMRETIDGPVTCSTCGERCPPNDPFGASGCAETPQGLGFFSHCRTCAAAAGVFPNDPTPMVVEMEGPPPGTLPVFSLDDPVSTRHDQIAALLDSAAQEFLRTFRIEYFARRLTVHEGAFVVMLLECDPRRVRDSWAVFYRRSCQQVRLARFPWLPSEANRIYTIGEAVAEACTMDEAIESGQASLRMISGAPIYESNDRDRLMRRVDAACRVGIRDARRYRRADDELMSGGAR